MRREKTKNQTGMGLAIFAGLFVMLFFDGLMIVQQQRQYREKMEMITTMLGVEEKEELLSTAVSLWKGENIGESQRTKGQEMAKKYGYDKIRATRYGKELIQDCVKSVILSMVVFAAYLLVLIWIEKKARQEKERELQEISGILERFQRRQYKSPEVPLTEEAGTILQIYGGFESLGEMLEILEERMEKEKEETKSLVTDISHQLKTPVAALKACFEILLQEDLSEEERQEFSQRCKRQLNGLENLLTALINISRMETGMIQVKKEMADISETIVSAISRVYLKAQEKQISIEMEPASDAAEAEMTRIVISHDVKWTCEAVINILENAIKYSSPETTIKIRMQKLTSFLRIEIQDEGIGIPKEEYHKIFKRFYRSQAEEVQKQDGSGIGLYLTREIIDRQNGSVTVSAKCTGEKTGSVFTIQLPYA